MLLCVYVHVHVCTHYLLRHISSLLLHPCLVPLSSPSIPLLLPSSHPSLPLLLTCSGGDTIRQIQVQSGAHVELHRGAQPNPSEKLFNIRGTPQQIQLAQQLVRQKYENIPGAGGPQFGHPGCVRETQ